MADVVLNLVYNDNNARKEVDGLISQLQKIESRSYRIQFDRSSVPAFIKEIDNLTAKLNNIRKIDFRTIGAGIGYGASISGIERYIDKISDSISKARQQMDELAIEMSRLGGSGSEVDDLANQYDKLAEEVDKYKVQLAYAKKLHEELTSSHTAEIEQQISDTEKAAQEFEKAQEEKARSAREAAEKIKEAEIEITQGYHQMLRGMQQTYSGFISTLTAGWNTFKSVVEAPMNLTGVSSLVSMLESMEGSLLLDQISSNITRGFSESVTRFDILRTFPAVMESIGFSGAEASDSMDKLYQSVLGLPTAFEDIVQTTQYFALVLDDLDKATQLSIAANNAFVASGATSQQITTGMRQLQYLIDGTKLRSTQWYSLIRSMPVALREVGVALGYPDFTAFTADLMGGKIATDELIDSLIQVGTESPKIAGVIDTMKNRVQASLDNVANAARRMGTTILDALDTTLQRTGGKGIAENIRGVSSILDHIAQVAADWISSHGRELQALLDKFFKIDWASVIPSFFEGLVEFANNALDNIRNYITEIGNIITSARQFFNDVENSRLVAIFSGGASIISSLTQMFAGIGNIVAGLRLVNIGNGILSSLGAPTSAGITGFLSNVFGGASMASIASVLGVIAADILAIKGLVALTTPHDIEANAEHTRFLQQPEIVDYAASAKKNYYSYLNKAIEAKRNNQDDLAWDYIERANAEADTVSRYSTNDFVPKIMRDDLGYLIELYSNYEEPFVKEISKQDKTDIEKIAERIKNRADLIKQIAEIYDTQISEIDEKITELQEKRQELIDKINAAPPVLGRDFFKSLGLISDKYEEAEGKDYMKEAEDAEKFYTENLPKFQGWVKSVSDYISSLEEGETKNIAQEYFSALLSGFDVTDADQLKYILETLGGKTPEQVVEDFLQQQAAAIAQKDWEDTINQYLADQLGLTIEEYEQQKDSLEKEKSSAIGFLVSGIDSDYELLQEKYPEVLSYISSQDEELSNEINHAFDSVTSTFAVDMFDSYYGDIKDKILREQSEVRRLMQISPGLPSYSPTSRGGQTAPLATGGFLFAPMGTDTIPAMLTPGEYVQRRAAVEHFGRQFMERINNLDLRGALRSISMNYATPYATGGFVRNDNRNYRDNHATVNQIFKSANASTGFRRASRFVRALG